MDVMKNKKLTSIVIAVTAIFVVAAVLFMFGGNIFSGGSSIRKTDSTLMPEATGTTNEIKRTVVVEQSYINTTDTISKIGIVFTKAYYLEDVDLTIELLQGNNVLASTVVDVAEIEEQHRTYVEPVAQLSGMKNKKLTLRIYSTNKTDTGIQVMMADSRGSSFTFGKKEIDGTLCFSVTE